MMFRRGRGGRPYFFNQTGVPVWRIHILLVFFLLSGGLILLQLFRIQVLKHQAYLAQAQEQYQIFREVQPKRGEIYWQDLASRGIASLVINKPVYNFFVVPKLIKEPSQTAVLLVSIFPDKSADILAKINRRDDPYALVETSLENQAKEKISQILERAKWPADTYGFEEELKRYYLENGLGGHLTGFLGIAADGKTRSGQYGLEEYYDDLLRGQAGLIEADKDASGRPIAIGRRIVKPAQDGADIILTIDRNIQYKSCQALAERVAEFQATGGTVIVMNPADGSIYALCNYPTFDPNNYQAVAMGNFVDPSLANSYEPGSVFKPITMAAAIDQKAVTPRTSYLDTGAVVIDKYTIGNAHSKIYGQSTMSDVLDKSINTGAIFAFRAVGQENFRHYVNNFGFGKLTGIELAGESDGDVHTLDLNQEIYYATSSFGQGITVTPMQLITAYAAIARGGRLVKPTIIKSLKINGVLKNLPLQEIGQVISPETAETMSAMLTSVIENGFTKRAQVPGYKMAGKTGTAQIPNAGEKGYSEETIHTFVGFGPVGDGMPAFVILVKLDKPQTVPFADSSSAPLFAEIAKFILDYLQIPPQTSP
ncbi:MAG TPA: hypothetical protein DDX47_03710 [Candidatus Jacksonbacteria bacterium]|nr:hypothetical protein [Candidatus Jacksonbacteria bacterium]HCC50355.1 hypothetical protein [Candidatus Jacksonbacteria bacterium]HCE49627.1 hypothetical protein [Candidatus Jacksonbacteria bacterium]HCR15333.1 hypothetical protein [Candidatus Jacksonbacteria bacterium]